MAYPALIKNEYFLVITTAITKHSRGIGLRLYAIFISTGFNGEAGILTVY